MKRVALSLLVPLFLAAGCTNLDAPKKPAASPGLTAIELTPAPQGFPLGLGVSEGFAFHLFDTPSPTQGFKKFPPDTGFKRHFDEFSIAGKQHLVITEESTPPKLYFDENRNGDLTDDRAPSLGEGPALLPNHYSFQILYDEENVVAPYRLWLFGSNMGGVRFYPACHWHGAITIKDSPYNIVAFDANCDGDYSNDPLVIDVNGNGKAEDDEKVPPGGSITINGEQVRGLSVSRSGLTVRFKL